jgi:thioredoxin 1
MGAQEIQSMAEWRRALEAKDELVVLACFSGADERNRAVAPVFQAFAQARPVARFYQLNLDPGAGGAAVARELGLPGAAPALHYFRNGECVFTNTRPDAAHMLRGITGGIPV